MIDRKHIEVRDTSAINTQKEVDSLLNENNITVDNYKYIGYETKPIILNGTIYDLNSEWNEKSKLREAFEIDTKTNIITIPNFFVKINGTLDDDKKQKKLIKNLTKESTIFYDFSVHKNYIQSIPIENLNKVKEIIKTKKINKDSIQKIIELTQNYINDENIMTSLNSYMTKIVIKKLDDFIPIYLKSEKIKKPDYDCLCNAVLNIIYMDKSLSKQLNNWDFSSVIPKIVVFDESNQASGKETDFLLIDFYNYLGMDVAIIAPSGKSSIEAYEFELNNGLLSNIILDRFIQPLSTTRAKKEKTKNKIIKGIITGISTIALSSALIFGVNSIKNHIEESNTRDVQNVINQINEIGDVTFDDEQKIADAYYAYNRLPSSLKNDVTNSEKLDSAVEEMSLLKENQESISKVNNVIDSINEISIDDNTVSEIRQKTSESLLLYEKLSESEKQLVTNYAKLQQAQTFLQTTDELTDIVTVKSVIKAIDEIGEVTIESKDAINSANLKYSMLSEDNKKDVSNYDKLIKAMETYEELASIREQEQKVENVIELIDSLPEPENVDGFSYDNIVNTYYAYEELSPEEKDKITNYDKLVACEEKYDELSSLSFVDYLTSNPTTFITLIFMGLILILGAISSFLDNF